MNIGRSIRIYLDDGSVSGIRHAEIVNWTGQAISAPRTQIKALAGWPESQKPGVYFLFGVDEESGEKATYIGEAENVFERLQNHIAYKEFWNEAVFFTNKDENLTKSHVKYLESRVIELAKKSERYVILNSNNPQPPLLPRGDRDAMEEFLSNLITLIGVIGHKALEPVARSVRKTLVKKSKDEKDQEIIDLKETNLILNVRGIEAHAILSDEGIAVLRGSEATKNARPSLSAGYQKLRTRMIGNGVLIDSGEKYKFTKDQLFTSPSQAAAVIVGYSINGRKHWRTSSGVTLKNLEEAL